MTKKGAGPWIIATDMDRTVIPNGREPESPQAREFFKKAARNPRVILAYVTGRHMGLIRQALEEFDLPTPDFAIGDVGTTLYRVSGDRWTLSKDWEEEISRDWGGRTRQDLAEALTPIRGLTPQEEEKQNIHKLSYYTEPGDEKVADEVRRRLESLGVSASVISSVDEESGTGLLDVLPRRATKIHAVRFLVKERGFSKGRVLVAGDSGNDLPALTSGLNAVLVKNAARGVREAARRALLEKGLGRRLYEARGGYLGMNGNYAAGVLEGLAHFFPALAREILEA